MPEAPLLEARNVGRRAADGRWLFRDVSFDVSPGERWAVRGPTGSGKTLLLRSLSLLDAIGAGEFRWNGRAIPNDAVPEFRRQVIYLHQRPVVVDGTVEENLQLPFALRCHTSLQYDRLSVLDLLKPLGRGDDFLRAVGSELSGGEAQVLALVRALQLQPAVMLLDEPTAALDSDTTSAVETLVDRWLGAAETSRAVIWVTHDPSQAERVADKTLRLDLAETQE